MNSLNTGGKSTCFETSMSIRRAFEVSWGSGVTVATVRVAEKSNSSPCITWRRTKSVTRASANSGSSCGRTEEHTSELQSLMRISYAVFCLKKKKKTHTNVNHQNIR